MQIEYKKIIVCSNLFFCYNYIGDNMIKSDSRRIVPGDTFIAIKGKRVDGHDYIDAAIKNGATRIIASHGKYDVDTLIVKDTKLYLKNYLKKTYSDVIKKMTIIGVTGTNGKTTISYLVYQALNMMGLKCAMIGTLGFYLEDQVEVLQNTCPDLAINYELIINAYNNGYKYIVLEASSQGLKEDRLYGIKFDYAIFTNLTHDHLDYHKTMTDYCKSKQKLFHQLKSNGVGIINVDDVYYKFFKSKNTITYGFKKSDYQILNYNCSELIFRNKSVFKIEHSLIGKHNMYNLMATLIVLEKIGLNLKKSRDLIKKILPPDGRMDIINYNSNKIIIDYAHTPDAINQVINSLKNYNSLYAVFGCTGNRDRMKRPIMTRILSEKCKHIIITTDDLYDEDFEHIVKDMLNGLENDNYTICFDRKSAIEQAVYMLKDNDILLILGKGHEKYLKIKNSLIKFNDRETVLNIIKK